MPQTSLLSFFTAKAPLNNVGTPAKDRKQGKSIKQPTRQSEAARNWGGSSFPKESILDTIVHSDPSSEASLISDKILASDQPSTPTPDQSSTPPSSPPISAFNPVLSDNLTYISTFYSPRETSPSPYNSSNLAPIVEPAAFQEPPLPPLDVDHNTYQAESQSSFSFKSTPQKSSSTLKALRDSLSPQAPNEPSEAPTSPVKQLTNAPSTSPLNPSQSSLTSTYTVEPISFTHLPSLRTLTASLLPLKYSNDFYNSTLQTPFNALTFTVLYNLPPITPSSNPSSRPIGWIRGRLDPQPTPSILSTHGPRPGPSTTTSSLLVTKPRHALYIAVLALSASHRSQGLATALLNQLTSPQIIQAYNIQYLYAHVWEENYEGIAWYEKRGFRRWGAKVEGYYRKLKPGGAWIVRLDI